MTLQDFQVQMTQLGEQWAGGDSIDSYSFGDKNIVFNPNQNKFINSKVRYSLIYGGLGSGKTVILCIKMILMCLCFPGNQVLLGKKHISGIESIILPDLFDLMPKKWYHYKVKQGIIEFFNGSKIIFFGLDSLQDGSMSDIKKAEQRIKGLNLGAYFIDQLEEIEYSVFKALTGRLRRDNCPWRQGNMTCNPANFWAQDFFLINPKKNTEAIQTSMLDNEKFLPDDYIEDQLSKDKRYVERYVHGNWTTNILTDKAVFAEEHIKKWKSCEFTKEEGCEIYEQPQNALKYRMGIDPSEGVVDPSSISVVSEDGHKVAKFNGKIPIHALGKKVNFLYYKYGEPLIVPEYNASGQALRMQIQDLNVYERKVIDEKYDKETRKQGFKTSYQSKQLLISHFQELLNKDFPKIYDKKTIGEFNTFVWSDSAKQKGAGAQRNFHDDDVMCYSNDTDVLTQKGWKRIDDVAIGEMLPSMNLETKNVELSKVIDVFSEEHNGEMLRFQGRTVDLLVTPNHKMVASLSKGANEYTDYSLIEARKLYGKHFRLKQNSNSWKGKKKKYWSIPAFSNKKNKYCSYEKLEKKIDIKEFLTFLGFYISEGCIPKAHNNCVIVISQKEYSKGYKGIEDNLNSLGFKWKYNGSDFKIYDKQFGEYINKLVPGYCFEKRIPREILELDSSLLKYVYDSLMLGDGCADRIYTTTSDGLKDDFVELVARLGWACTVNKVDKVGDACFNGTRTVRHIIYYISINRTQASPRFNHHKSFGATVERIDYIGRITCPSLEKNNTLLVRRNGKMCWSGNSTLLAYWDLSPKLTAKRTIKRLQEKAKAQQNKYVMQYI